MDYAIEADQECPSDTGRVGYCVPQVYRAQPDRLFRNRGDGSFADVTATALAGTTFGPALGVATADFDGDGWPDIYVANDGEENQLWMNRRDGTLADAGLVSGAALNGNGAAEGSMGVDAGDFDNDGDEDLFMTHLTTETNTLYVNDGNGMFEDRSALSGLGPPSLAATGFGTAWLDFDNDGRLDVLTVNGRVSRTEERADEPFPYDQTRQLFRNLGDGRFEEVTGRGRRDVRDVRGGGAGPPSATWTTTATWTCWSGTTAGRVRLLVNRVESTHRWLGLRLVGGAEAPRDMLGARVEVATSDGTTLWRRARADGSYGSANDPRVHVGLGDATEVSRIRVYWPGGRVEEWTDVPLDRWTTLTEGSGR